MDSLARRYLTIPATARSPTAVPLSTPRPVVAGLALLVSDLIAGLAAVASVGVLDGHALRSIVTPDLAVVFIALVAYLAARGRYNERIPFWNEAAILLSAACCALAALFILFMRLDDAAAGVPALSVLVLFPAWALLANSLVKKALVRLGVWTLPVVVLGEGEGARALEAAFGTERSLGYRIVSRIDPTVLMAGTSPAPLASLLRRYQARCLLIAIDGDPDMQRRVTECALRERLPFAVAPQPHDLPTFASRSIRFFSHDATLLSFRDGLADPVSRILKSAMDVCVASLMLLLLAPLLVVVSVAVRLDGGPALFAHRRVGVGGRTFDCLKFRTMVTDADRVLAQALDADPKLADEWKVRRKLEDDPRITRLGGFLRRTSIDELPQLINVLRRDMSLVGPRPIVEGEIPLYGDPIAQYYATRPGLTGLWQVSGRSETSYARRVQLDVWYVNNWSIWHDLTLLLKTVPAVLGRSGAQ